MGLWKELRPFVGIIGTFMFVLGVRHYLPEDWSPALYIVVGIILMVVASR